MRKAFRPCVRALGRRMRSAFRPMFGKVKQVVEQSVSAAEVGAAVPAPGVPAASSGYAGGGNAILWPPDWTEMYAAGGTVGSDYIRVLQNYGIDNINVAGDNAATRSWVTGLVAAAGMKRLWCEASAWPSAGATHPEYEHDVNWADCPGVTEDYRLCPNYRGTDYDKYHADWHSGKVDTYSPLDYFVTGVEYWYGPERIVDYLDRYSIQTDLIDKCSRCGGIAGYKTGWADAFNDATAYARTVNPGAEVYAYGDYDYSSLSLYNTWNATSYARPTELWGGYGDGPCPILYAAQFTPDPTGYLQYLIDNGLKVAGGYPWVTVWATNAYKAGAMMTTGQFGAFCRVLAENGAKGFSVYPGPNRTSENMAVGSANSAACFKLILEGMLAFGSAA